MVRFGYPGDTKACSNFNCYNFGGGRDKSADKTVFLTTKKRYLNEKCVA